MYRLVLLRHGESTWNKENRFTGWTDVDLSETGRTEAKAAGELLKEGGYVFDVAYTSVLTRAIRTLFIALDGMYVGIDMYSDITLGHVMFVKHRSVQVGSYTYDEPSGEKDERIVPFGKVAAIAFSEAMGDLAKVSGKSSGQTEGEDA